MKLMVMALLVQLPHSGKIHSSIDLNAAVAQLVEHLFCTQAVGGSSPLGSSMTLSRSELLSQTCKSHKSQTGVEVCRYG